MVKLATTEPYRSVLADAGFSLFSLLPRGSIVATCILYDCVPTSEFQGEDFLDSAFGDFSSGRFAWRLRNVQALRQPIEARGALGLWEFRFLSDEVSHGRDNDRDRH